MPRHKMVKRLTNEQRERILQSPGEIVHRRNQAKEPTHFKPAIWVEQPISVRELLGRDEDIWTDQDSTE